MKKVPQQFSLMVRTSFAFLLLHLMLFAVKQQIASVAILNPVDKTTVSNSYSRFSVLHYFLAKDCIVPPWMSCFMPYDVSCLTMKR